MRRYLLNALRWAIPFRASYGGVPLAGILHKPCYSPRRVPLGQRCFTNSRIARSAVDGDSTIYALSTAPGRAAIAVVRISGPACVQIYKALCPKAFLPRPRVAALRALYDPTQEPSPNSVIDAGALVLYFPGPKTVTGEDVLELHLHGGPAIVKSVLTAIARSSRGRKENEKENSLIRYAEPGEFTRRAFMNDRLDLPQIEALGHTLSADTEQQRRLAVRGSSNALSERYELWRRQLLYARGELEALIDFSEDQHFDESSDELVASVAAQVRSLRLQINLHIQNASKGELLRNGIKVALLGAPNAGKSSLLNLIVGKEAAIVSTEEGTTRDIVDVGVDLGGWYCKLGDMAGIRSESSDYSVTEGSILSIGAVEKEGIRRAKVRALESDVVLVILSLEKHTTDDNGASYELSVEQEVLDAARDCVQAGKHLLVVVNKCDRLGSSDQDCVRAGHFSSDLAAAVREHFATVPKDRIFLISCREAQKGLSYLGQELELDPGNIQGLLKGLISTFEQMASPLGIEGDQDGQYDINYWEDSLGVTHRQGFNLQRCLQHLDDFLTQTAKTENLHIPPHDNNYDGIDTEVDIVTAAEHLRFAADALAMITGKGDSGDVEDVLGVVFEKYDFSAFPNAVALLTAYFHETGSALENR